MTLTQPQFKPGDRVFTHYDMKWGTVERINKTCRDQTHGVTGSKLPDTTWYDVKYDDGSTSLLDDGHGNWDMARIVPPHIAKRYGYGDDPNPSGNPPEREFTVTATLVVTGSTVEEALQSYAAENDILSAFIEETA